MGLILASASPRRQELLRLITEDFTVFPAAVEESLPPALSVLDAAQYLARKKRALWRSSIRNMWCSALIPQWYWETGIRGKPGTPERAAEMLRMLSGKTHQVVTGVALAKGTRVVSFQTETEVTFYPLTEAQIQNYVATREPLDKAGGYGIQGRGALLVEKINGDFYSVVGLPVAAVSRALRAFSGAESQKGI